MAEMAEFLFGLVIILFVLGGPFLLAIGFSFIGERKGNKRLVKVSRVIFGIGVLWVMFAVILMSLTQFT